MDMFETLKKELPDIKKDVLLKDYTTFKIGGPADYFLEAFEKEVLIKAIKLAEKQKLPIFVFGGGSNLLVSDNGIRGLTIRFRDHSLALENNVIVAGAGIELKQLVDASIEHSLQGLEWAGGLPGTFGGAVRGNAGAFGGEMKDSILSVQALDDNLAIREFLNKECQFDYRSSIFKQNNWIVLSASVQLKEGNQEELGLIAESHRNYRKERHPLDYPNAGSIFKNVPLPEFSKDLQEKLASIVKQDPFPVVPTAYLISEAGLKGTTVGKAQVSDKHPNFIINLGGASADDVLKLIDLVKEKVNSMYGIHLEVEVQMVGF